MRALAVMAEMAARVLREHADMPAVCGVRIDDRRVSLQLAGSKGKLPSIARWAQALQTSVVVTPCSTFVEITVSKPVDVAGVEGVTTVEVWTHLDLADLLLLAQRVGVVVDTRGGPVEITPQRLLAMLDDSPTSGRVA